MREDDFTPDDLIEKDESCTSCEHKKKKCISFFAHENDMMHKDIDNERAHRTTLFVCITFIIITVIFVTAYTMRMNTFVDLIREMNAALLQLASAKGIPTP